MVEAPTLRRQPSKLKRCKRIPPVLRMRTHFCQSTVKDVAHPVSLCPLVILMKACAALKSDAVY
jgi:hypothetical protein